MEEQGNYVATYVHNVRVCSLFHSQSHTASGKNRDLVKELEAYEVSVPMRAACAIAVLHPLHVRV